MTPPSIHDLPAGYKLRAGLGYSTVLPDLDFETYSEAGFVWNEAEQKWGALPGASQGKKGLSIVGTVRYCQHPTARVLSLAYNLKNGTGEKLWRPGDPLPVDLFAHVLQNDLLEAHNSAFEYWVWNLICTKRYGFPSLEVSQLRCSMAKARAYSLPGALGNLTQVLPVQTVKEADGDRLLKKFSIPRNPTKNDKRLYLDPATDPVDGPKLYGYNLTDIKAESEVSAQIPDLEGVEADYFLIDRTINVRGVHIDRESLEACCTIVTDMLDRNEAELRELTGGVVETASQLERLKGWLGARGVVMDVMDDEAITAALPGVSDPLARRALEIRQAVGSASVKKVFAMRNQLPPDNRLRELFNYHGARTGRPTGEGPQPTNLPKAGPSVKQCKACNHYFGVHISTVCPWCNVPLPPSIKTEEWSWKATEDTLAVLRTKSIDTVAHYFGEVMLTVSGSLRGLFTAAPGKVLMCSDYSAIEGVVIAALSGEQWRLDVFATHGKIYELSASKITGTPFEEYARYKAETGQHHPTRGKVGKVAELACLSAETKVLTDRGYVDIVDVLLSDKLWDGKEWVHHQGLVSRGKKDTLILDGVRMTPDHKINCNGFWQEARQLVLSQNILTQSLAFASENLPWSGLWKELKGVEKYQLNALVIGPPTWWRYIRCLKEQVHDVTIALKGSQADPNLKTFGNMSRLSLTWKHVVDYLTESPLLLPVAIARQLGNTEVMAAGAFTFGRNGGKTEASFCDIWSTCMDMTIRVLSLIGSTAIKGTSRAILDLLLGQKTALTKEKLTICNTELSSLRDVYDIAHAGPRNQFTIKTNSGHLIVHNCGFGGWVNSWKAFSGDDGRTDDEIKREILAWRDASPAIVEFWGGQGRGKPWGNDYVPELFGLEGMAIKALLEPGTWFDYRGTAYQYSTFADVLFCRLVSGRCLSYHKPRLARKQRFDVTEYAISYETWNSNPKYGAMGWVRMDTYSGRLAENVVQATARDIQRHAQIQLEARGYPVVLHIYDENVSEVPIGYGSIEEFEAILMDLPEWAKGWPIKASGGWVGERYRKD